MYDKKKTIKGYMGGGYMKPMSYANGGYIPGLSSLLYGAGLRRDVRTAQEEFEKQSEKVAKEKKYRAIGGKIGKFLGKAAGYALAVPTGGVSVPVGEAVGATLGQAGGELAGGSLVDAGNIKGSSTGLYKDDFDYLRKVGKETESLKGLAERSAVAGATTYGAGKLGELTEGTEFDFGEATLKDYFTDTARTTGIGGDKFAEEVTTQGLLDNIGVFDDEDFITMTMEEQAQQKAGEKTKELLSEYISRTGSVKGYFDDDDISYNKDGGIIQQYQEGGMAKKKGMGYFDREFPKDSFKALIQEAVYKGELDPREGLQHILNKQQKDFMKSKDDTSNALYKRLQEAGYSKGGKIEEYGHGGLIDMNPFSRRIL